MHPVLRLSIRSSTLGAAQAYMNNPMGSPPIPNWNRVKSAIPDIFEMLRAAVESDAK